MIVLAQHIIDPVQNVRFFSGETCKATRLSMTLADAALHVACWQVVQIIQRAGYRAAIPSNQRYGGEHEWRHQLSFKKAGALAGLGVIGRSQLLVHPEWGPWLWLRTVITEASLPADAPLTFAPCEGCEACLSACPTGALTKNGVDRQLCRVCVEAGLDSSTRWLSAHGHLHCEECWRACPVGTAPPRLQEVSAWLPERVEGR